MFLKGRDIGKPTDHIEFKECLIFMGVRQLHQHWQGMFVKEEAFLTNVFVDYLPNSTHN